MDRLELILCYNTPTPMLGIEGELAAMAGQVQEQGRSLRVLKARPSLIPSPSPDSPSPGPITLTPALASRRMRSPHYTPYISSKVEGSRSKAENLNSALELVGTENVVIYDADHHADPDSLIIATRYICGRT